MLFDFRHAFRQLTKAPGFTAVIVLTLALGIGANTAIFSFFYGILLRPLPVVMPERVALIRQSTPSTGDLKFTADEFLELQARSRTLDELACYSTEIATITGYGAAEAAFCAIVSPNFFSLLGARPRIGRVFAPDELTPVDGAIGPRQAVLSDRFWRQHFGAQTALLGQSLVFNGVPFTVIGIMPPGFEFPRWVDFWLSPAGPLPEREVNVPGATELDTGALFLSILGRASDGVSASDIEKEFAQLLSTGVGSRQVERMVRSENLHQRLVGSARPALAMLLGCVGLVLLLACANVANLLLARATTRQREMGIRAALGGTRWRVARQLLTESMVLAGLGGIAGVLLGTWGTDLLIAVAPTELPRLSEVRLDMWVIGFAVGVSVMTGIAFGIVPAFHAASVDLTRLMKEGETTVSAGAGSLRLRGALVAAEVAVSLVLMIVAVLLFRSFSRTVAVDLGLDTHGVVKARVVFGGAAYDTPEKRLAVYRAVQDRLASVAGIESIGLSWNQPVNEVWLRRGFAVDSVAFDAAGEVPQAGVHPVSPGFFDTLRIDLRQGRGFTPADDEHAPPVVIVNESLARHFFPVGKAVGGRLRFINESATPEGPWAEIVGVVEDVRHDGAETPAGFQIYQPYPQAPIPSFFVTMRTRFDPTTAGNALKGVVASIDPKMPVSYVADLAETAAWPGVKRRFALVLVGTFAALALVLAAVGIYAVMTYAVTQRLREIGIRMAMGASREAVVRLVLRHAFQIVGAGLLVGVAGGAGAALLLERLLYETQPLDPVTFVTVPLVFAAIALLACWVPVRRATRIDPAMAMRAE
jgi:putative ABC transport system permease protein